MKTKKIFIVVLMMVLIVSMFSFVSCDNMANIKPHDELSSSWFLWLCILLLHESPLFMLYLW